MNVTDFDAASDPRWNDTILRVGINVGNLQKRIMTYWLF